MQRSSATIVCALALAACSSKPEVARVNLPDGSIGIGFDDLRYSPGLHRVLVPAGRSGRVDLIDPDTLEVASIEGFGSIAQYTGGHDDGPTSIDESTDFLYVADRTRGELVTVDKATARIVGRTALSSPPDYVRFVASTHEVWVTEPGADQIEVFGIGTNGVPAGPSGIVGVSNGPESLLIDELRGRAYTHRWQASTVAIDLRGRQIAAEWPNGCAASRGIALDEARGFLFAVCSEGATSVLEVNAGGRILSSLTQGAGFDVVGYSPSLRHLYLAGSSCSCLVTLGVSPSGVLNLLAHSAAPRSTHCAAADDEGHVWVCDQDHGQIWRVMDNSPAPR